MSSRHSIRVVRRLAMQVLYQMDVSGETDREVLLAGLDEDHDPLAARERAVEWAVEAWAARDAADAAVRELAPDWPTHRQPPVDRAILRLAHFEIVSGRTPMKVAINEAVVLSKEYGSEHSPPFINAVLDKLSKRVTPATPDRPKPPADERQTPDAWLKDALTSKG